MITSYKDVVIGASSWIPNVSGIEGATSWSATDYDCVITDTAYTANNSLYLIILIKKKKNSYQV